MLLIFQPQFYHLHHLSKGLTMQNYLKQLFSKSLLLFFSNFDSAGKPANVYAC